MSLSMHEASIPAFTRGLDVLSTILGKAASYAKENNIEEKTLVTARLAPDMFALSRQIQSACDTAKLAVQRITGIQAPRFEDTETTLAQLQERIAKTTSFLKGIDAAALESGAERTVTLSFGPTKISFRGDNYLLHEALPNFYFHVTTAYDILRHNGLKIGKRDFLGPYDEQQEMKK
jgi:uncharacterized protein